MARLNLTAAFLCLMALPAFVGCFGSNSEEEPELQIQAKPLEEFKAPPLAELDAKAEWIDNPVLDGLELLQAEQKKSTPPATVAEALALKNDSDAANKTILETLGRLPQSPTDVNEEATITRLVMGDPKSLNPLLFTSVVESEIGGLMSFGFIGFDWNLRPFASKDSVVSWQTSKDRLSDKIVMRKDCTWSDGKPITAHDVVFSFKTILDTRIPIPAVRSQTDELRWVEAYDDYTLVFFHKEASQTNWAKIGFPIVPKHIYEVGLEADTTLRDSDYHQKYEKDPVVGGAYKLVKHVQKQEYVLERREDYYMHQGKKVRDKPYFKTVRFIVKNDPNVALLALKEGDLDEMMLLPELWMKQTIGDDFYRKNTKARGVEWVYFYFGWNAKRADAPFFADPKVREAMGYAFDHEEMLKTLCYGLYEPCTGIFHPTAPMASKNPPAPLKKDVARAEKLLDEAGWKDSDGDGIRDKMVGDQLVKFDFTIVCSNIPQRISICNLLKQNLDEIGVKCNVRPLDTPIVSAMLEKKDYQANFGGWGTGADPSTLKNIWKTGESRNFNSYSNPEVDRLLKEAEVESDRDKRNALYGKIDDLIYADHSVTFLYNQSSFYAFNKQLRGYKFSPRGPYSYSPGFSSIWRAKMQ